MKGWRLYKKLHFFNKFYVLPYLFFFFVLFFFPPDSTPELYLSFPSYFPFISFTSIFCILFLILLSFLLVLLFLIIYFRILYFYCIPLLFSYVVFVKSFFFLIFSFYVLLLSLLHLSPRLFQLHIFFFFVNVPAHVSKDCGPESNKRRKQAKKIIIYRGK